MRSCRALVREVSATLASAIQRAPAAVDVERARGQHAAYVAALRAGGFDVTVLPADDAHPDAVFVEDPVVVIGERAWMTRSAAPSRVGEGEAIAAALAALGLEVRWMTEGVLDGGDVLRAGRRMWVGRSERTDDAGISALARAFPECEVLPVQVPDALHLKSVASAVSADVVLAVAGLVLPGAEVRRVPWAERAGANVVPLPDGRVLAAAGFPAVRAALEGFEVVELAYDELRKVDGALTCCSVRIGVDCG